MCISKASKVGVLNRVKGYLEGILIGNDLNNVDIEKDTWREGVEYAIKVINDNLEIEEER